MPRPNFEGVPLFKKSKDQHITCAALEYNFDYEQRTVLQDQYIKHFKPFWSSKSFHTKY